VKKVIGYAQERGKGIVFEDLKFDKDKTGSRKWKRKQSNFVWKKFITLLERKCVENGIQYEKVNPAFTSIIGKYKYRWMYKTSIHESAAFVIGLQVRLTDLKEFVGNIWYRGETLRGEVFLQELLAGSKV
jgi:IS605 OrfB family transposase